MGDFIKHVQADRVTGPLRRGFATEKWKRAFDAIAAHDDDDHRIYSAALVIYQKLENIRARLKLSSSPNLSATTKLRAFVAAANHNFIVARGKARDVIRSAATERAHAGLGGFRLDDLASDVKLELKSGFEFSPDEIVESLVDGIEIPVRFSLQSTPNLSGNPRMHDVEWEDIALELNLGVIFRHAEDLWNDCLWNGYHIMHKQGLKLFVPHGFDANVGYSVGIARRLSLSIGYSIMAMKYQRDLKARGIFPRLRDVRAIEREGKRQQIKLAKPGELTEAMEELWVMRGLVNEPYYSELLEESLPAVSGLTLSAIVDAWLVISRAAILLQEGVAAVAQPEDPDSPAHTWLPRFAPVLQIDSLLQALALSVGIQQGEGRRLIEFFTFRGRAGQEIWAQPLVPVGNATLAPVFGALVSPNLRRLTDVWMRQAGIDLAKRGPAFEAHIRASVHSSIDASKVLAGHASCLKDDYTFRPAAGREEQIDLLVVFGSTVLLAEVKCILEPSDAKGIAMHRRTVVGAAEQARRKSRCLKDNQADFIADMGRFGISLPLNFTVLPLVIVSSSTHVGIPVAEVPVIDEYIVGKFLEGELQDVGVHGEDLQIRETQRNIFYTDLADAESKAAPYFASPPQTERLLRRVKRRIVPIFPVSENDWGGYAAATECMSMTGDADRPSQLGGG